MPSRFSYPLWNTSESDRLFEIINSMMPLEGASTGMYLKCIQDASLSHWRNCRKLHLPSVRWLEHLNYHSLDESHISSTSVYF